MSKSFVKKGSELACAIYLHCKNSIGHDDDVSSRTSLEWLQISVNILMDLRGDLKYMAKRALARTENDGKLPPGSSMVKRCLSDERYLLYCINILRAHIYIDANRISCAKNALNIAWIWFPRGVEGSFLRADLLRQLAAMEFQIQEAEVLFQRTIEYGEALKAEADSSTTPRAMSAKALKDQLSCENAATAAGGGCEQLCSADGNPSLCPPPATATAAAATAEWLGFYSELLLKISVPAVVCRSILNTLVQDVGLVQKIEHAFWKGDFAIVEEDAYPGDQLFVKQQEKLIQESELSCLRKGRELLILMLCQQGRTSDAYRHLQAGHYSWRLAKAVLQYPYSMAQAPQLLKPDDVTEQRSIVQAVDSALKPVQVEHLQYVFRPESPFWKEHAYDISCNASKKVGYFSYLYPLTTPRRPQCSIDLIIDDIYKLALKQFPALVNAKIAEWWVHSRPHVNGHQLHYDSDETRTSCGLSPRHPICSTVTYLTEGIGGPTLATNQRLNQDNDGALASKGWLVLPKLNRMVTFDATVLHGVIPGRGIPCHRAGAGTVESGPPSTVSSAGATFHDDEEKNPTPSDISTVSVSESGSGQQIMKPRNGTAFSVAAAAAAAENANGVKDESPPRRLTFMVGFWTEIAATVRGLDSPGPGQPFPDRRATSYTWPAEMDLGQFKAKLAATEAAKRPEDLFWREEEDSELTDEGEKKAGPTPVEPIPLDCIWEKIDAGMTRDEVNEIELSLTVPNAASASDLTAAINKRLRRTDESPHYSACFQGF